MRNSVSLIYLMGFFLLWADVALAQSNEDKVELDFFSICTSRCDSDDGVSADSTFQSYVEKNYPYLDLGKKNPENVDKNDPKKIEFSSIPVGYRDAINYLLTSKIGQDQTPKPFLARVTPFVYVAAIMQGAQLEILATYER